LIADAVDNQHLAVETIERAEAEVAVPQQFSDGDVAIVDAIEQRADRRRLVHRAAMPMREHRARPTAQDARSGLGRLKRHRGSMQCCSFT
jgi:hypothetical protein